MMKRYRFIVTFGVAALFVLLAVLAAIRMVFQPHRASAARRPGSLHVVATVKTARLVSREVDRNLQTYGTVVARTSSVRNVAVSFESQCLRVLVSSGQEVHRGEKLLELQASSTAMLALAEARNQAAAAAAQYQQTLASRRLHLVTNAQLLAARHKDELARLELDNLLSQGVGGPRYIKSNRSGVINHIYAAPGQITVAGSPLLQIVSSHRIEVRIGVEPTDIPFLRNGMHVKIYPIGEGVKAPVPGTISLVTLRVNPATRLVDVFVTPQSSSGLLLGEYVRASITIARLKGLVAPRAAVLPDGHFQDLYTVRHGLAHLYHVRIILKKPHEYLIAAPGLAVGDRIVIEGNPQLKNLMAVTEKFHP